MKHFNTARTLTAASLLALAALGAQAAVPSPEENGPVRQVCPQIDSKMQQALDRGVQKLQTGTLARVEFTVKGDKVSQVRQQNVPTEMRRQVQQAMRELKCQSNGEQALAFNLNLLPN
jgi:membrane-bound lytic murein transglycosylase